MMAEMGIVEAAIRGMCWDGVIPLGQVLRYTLPAYPFDTWPQALARLRAEPSEAAIIAILAGELAASPDRLFTEPVRVYFTEPADWDEQDRAEYGDRPILPRVGNGMHRIAATIMAGAEFIKVSSADTVPEGDVIRV